VQAQLSDIQESKLIGLRKVESEQLDKAVLRNSEAVLHLEATTALLALLGELIIHLLHSELEET
jgi:hypothetical protein